MIFTRVMKKVFLDRRMKDVYKKCIFKSVCKEDCASMFLSGSICDVCPFSKDFIKSFIEKKSNEST